MTEPALRRAVAGDIHALAARGEAPVVVHGGGPFIAEALARAGVTSSFVRGLRVTSAESLPIVEQVLTQLSKVLAQEIGEAVGLSGRDAHLLVAEPLPGLGFVGRMTGVNKELLETLLAAGLTPVIACLAEGGAEGVLNVNADSVASAVAGTLRAPVVFLSVAGVLETPGEPASLLPRLDAREIAERLADGRISGGMIPKVEAALEALTAGAAFAVIADGREPGQLEAALKGRAGTRIYRE